MSAAADQRAAVVTGGSTGRSLDGRIAVVSGGGRGIGAAIAQALAVRGAAVAILYRRDAAAAEATGKRITGDGGTARCFEAPVEDRERLQIALGAFTDEFGAPDILVNNAGQASRGHTVVDTEAREVEALFRTHALGAFQLCQLLLPGMRARPRSDIVMISSVATRTWPTGSAPYNMAKAAQEALAHTLESEETRHGVRVNVVAPAMTDTDMGTRAARGRYGAEDLHDLDARAPFGRVCPPEAVADAVAWLVSAPASHITGQRIALDGDRGWS